MLGVFYGNNNIGCWVCFMVIITLGVFHGKNNVGCWVCFMVIITLGVGCVLW